MTLLAPQLDVLAVIQPRRIVGRVAAVRGLSVMVDDLPLPIGATVRVQCAGAKRCSHRQTAGEVVGFNGSQSIIMLYGENGGLSPGARVVGEQSFRAAPVGHCLLGRVINGLGEPLDGGSRLTDTVLRPIDPPPTAALDRQRIDEPLPTGVAARPRPERRACHRL